MTTIKHIGYNMRYRAELRYFDKLGNDYIHLDFVGTTKYSAFNKALRYHKNNFKNDTAKINTFDMPQRSENGNTRRKQIQSLLHDRNDRRRAIFRPF